VSFAGFPLVFAEDVEVTASGHYVVAESVIGALWVITPDGLIAKGIFPDTGPIAALGPGMLPPVTVGGIPYRTAENFAPSVVSLASRKGQLYFSSTANGGLWRVPITSLTEGRVPQARAQDIVTVSPRPAGMAETFEGAADGTLARRMTLDSRPPDKRPFEISYFARYRYTDLTTIWARLPVLPVYTHLPGDYPGLKRIVACLRPVRRNSHLAKCP